MIRLYKDPKECSILAIDPSLNGSAIMYFYKGKLKKGWLFTTESEFKEVTMLYINNDILINIIYHKLTGHENKYKRLLLIRDKFYEILKETNPDYCVMEDYALGRKDNNVYDIGEMGSVYKLLMLDNKIPFRLYEPTKIKTYITGNHKAPKSQMVAKCLSQWKINFSELGKPGEDLADAFCIGQFFMFELKVHLDKKLLDSQPKYVKDVFLRTSKKYPVPLIRRRLIRN